MPRTRGTEMALKQHSPRAPPPHVKTSACAEANSAQRSSPKLDDRRSPLHERKRVSELESKLSHALEEVKKLKEQLAITEASKLDIKLQLQASKKESRHHEDDEEEEAPVPKEGIGEMSEMRKKLRERERVVERLEMENNSLKMQIKEVEAAHAKEEELGAKLSSMGDELSEIRGKAEELKKKLETEEKDKAMLEMEMKRLKVQTEQWRKAAETAAAVLAEDDGVWAMEKQLWIGSPEEEGLKGGRRKSSGGMKVFAELWKKKSGNSN